MKKCCVCGKEFKERRKDQKTCGNKECQHALHIEYLRMYSAERRKIYRSSVNEYNRNWMRNYRSKQKLNKPFDDKKETVAEDYAERQKAKTLQMVGKVEV